MIRLRSRAASSIAAIALTVWTGCVHAQRFDTVFGGTEDTALPLTQAGECPKKEKTSKTLTFEELDDIWKDEGLAPRQIILPKVKVYGDPRLTREIPNLALDFRQEVRVLHWDQRPFGAHFVKFGGRRANQELCGWLDRTALLSKQDGSRPRTVGELGKLGIEGFVLYKAGSSLDAKVLVRNREEIRHGKRVAGEGAGLYYRPDDPKPYGRLRIFNILNVYAAQRLKDRVWFYVGGQIEEQGLLKQSLLGWAKAEDLIPWSSTVSLYYRPEVKGAKIFESASQAERGRDAIAFQGADEVEPKHRNIPRFPVLDNEPRGSDLTLFKIAFPGSACLDRGRGECISARDFAIRRDDIGQRIDEITNIDILFVIDATESMRRYFPHVVTAVQRFVQGLAEDRRRVRFSVTVYGDYEAAYLGQINEDTGQFARVVPFGPVGDADDVQTLLSNKGYEDAMRDLPEAAFGAIIHAVDTAGWRGDAGWRLVIWIGDHPNREAGNAPKAIGPFFATEDVAHTLTQQKAAFVGINVKGRDYPSNNYLNDRFLAQAKAIVEQANEWGLASLRAYDPRSGLEDDETITQSVLAKLDEIMENSNYAKKQVFSIAVGQPVKELYPDLPRVRLAQRYIRERLGLSEAEIQDFFSRSQLVTRGWVRQEHTTPEFAFWIAMDKDQMARMIAAAQHLCATLSQNPRFDVVKKAMLQTLKSVTGDEPPAGGNENETNIRRFLAKRLHLPVDSFSPLLEEDIDGFVHWYKEHGLAEEVDTFRRTICKKAALLDYASAQKRLINGINDIYWNEDAGRWEARDGAEQPFNWLWKTEHGINYYYIPLDYVL